MTKKPPKKLYSELIVDFLSEKKITHVFDLSGGMIAFLEDAISKKRGIQCVPMHHEQGAGFAAEGYARVSQNFGVAMATSGPGATNLMTAIGSCYFDSIPAMFFVGHIHTDNIKKSDKIRQEGFQESDVVNAVKPFTKYAVLITNPNKIMYEIEKAFYIMKEGRPGSVLLNIPINLQRTEVDLKRIESFIGSKEYIKMEKDKKNISRKLIISKVEQLEKLLKNSKAPLVLIGNGVRLSDTVSEVSQFVKKNNLPVVTSLLGIDSYPYNDKLIGLIGSNGNRDANITFANADIILALGTRLDIRQTGDAKFFNPTAKVVHVDIDKYSIDYSIKSHLSFEMNLKEFFSAVKDIRTPAKIKWLSFIKNIKTQFTRGMKYTSKSVDPNTFIDELSKITSSKATILADVGQNQLWCAQSWKVKKGQRLLFSGGMGAMGFSLPASVGAWYANPKSELVVVCGDGGLQVNIQEMETVTRNGIPLKLFIMNNKSLGMVREFQDLYFNKNYQSTVIGYGCPPLKKIAYAYGFDYLRLDKLNKKDVVIRDAMKSKKPILVEVVIDMKAPLQPKVVYGHALDDQSPYLDKKHKEILENLKSNLKSS